MVNTKLQSMEVPIISRKGMYRLVSMLLERDLDRDSNLFDVGYEKAKKDIAIVLADELNVSFDNNPAKRLAQGLRRT